MKGNIDVKMEKGTFRLIRHVERMIDEITQVTKCISLVATLNFKLEHDNDKH